METAALLFEYERRMILTGLRSGVVVVKNLCQKRAKMNGADLQKFVVQIDDNLTDDR